MYRNVVAFPLWYTIIFVATTIFWLMYGEGNTIFLAVQFTIFGGILLFILLGEIADQLLELNQHLHRSQTKSTSTDVPSSG